MRQEGKKPTASEAPTWPIATSINTCLLGQIEKPDAVAGLDREADRIGTGSHVQCRKDRRAVHPQGALADSQLVGNLLVKFSLASVFGALSLILWFARFPTKAPEVVEIIEDSEPILAGGPVPKID